MTTYKDSGVDIEAGNEASLIAYGYAKKTFPGRAGKIGAPVTEEGGFAGLLDMGEYFLVQNDDGTGSKMELALAIGKLDTLGYDLLAMVADDAICMGAEVISVSNTLDVPAIDKDQIDQLMKGFSEACIEQNIIIPGGEIAEVPSGVCSPVWNATSIGVVAKDRVIDTASIAEGDTIISLRAAVARSNGFSLIRKILSDANGEQWYKTEWKDGVSWGKIMLTPSVVYHKAILSLIGRYGEKASMNVKGISHLTGGGVAENFRRTLSKSGMGASLTDLWEPHDAIKDLITLGSVEIEEAYRTWNMGNGMFVVVDSKDADQTVALLESAGVEAKVAGVVTAESEVTVTAFDGSVIES